MKFKAQPKPITFETINWLDPKGSHSASDDFEGFTLIRDKSDKGKTALIVSSNVSVNYFTDVQFLLVFE